MTTFTVQRLRAIKNAVGAYMENLDKFPLIKLKINTGFFYLPETVQDSISIFLRAPMDDEAAKMVLEIFDRFTCPQCKGIGRQCQCPKAEPVSP